MNILFLCRYFYPHIGGVEKHVMEISKLLIKQGHTVTVIAEKSSPIEKKYEVYKRIKIYRIPVGKDDWFKKWKIWFWLFRHRHLVDDAHVLHCHDVFFWYLPFRFLCPLKKVFTTFHGYESYPIKKKAIIVRKISEWLSFGNICVGDFIAKWYGTKPTFVTYGGVSLKNQKSPVRIAQGKIQKVGKHSAVFIGRLDEQTNILEYAEAVRLIRKKIHSFKFTIIGEGKYKDKLTDMTLPGAKINPEVYFKTARFAFVSRYLSMLEAFAAKRLVIALYDNPVKRDYVLLSPFSKLVIAAGSSTKLAGKINWVIKHPAKEKEFVEKGYRFASQHSWTAVVKKYLFLWKGDI